MSDAVSLVLFGAGGRMGRAITDVVAEISGLAIAARVGSTDPRPPRPTGAVVVVDFSSPTGASQALEAALAWRAPLVSGTTGLDDAYFAELDRASSTLPVLHAPNTSLGVAVLRHLVRQAATALPASFAAEIVEVHHGAKADAPSGTALALADDLAASRGDAAEDVVRSGRSGRTGPRPAREIGISAVRGGDVAGEHTVFFLGSGERIELTHRAGDRMIFARGAVDAARWLARQPAGRYTMDDMVGAR